MKTKILYIIGFLSICHFSKGTDDFNKAIDYLNCKLIELSLKGSDIKLQKFKNTCDCEIANFEKITSGLVGLNVNKTETLAIKLNGLKNENNC